MYRLLIAFTLALAAAAPAAAAPVLYIDDSSNRLGTVDAAITSSRA